MIATRQRVSLDRVVILVTRPWWPRQLMGLIITTGVGGTRRRTRFRGCTTHQRTKRCCTSSSAPANYPNSWPCPRTRGVGSWRVAVRFCRVFTSPNLPNAYTFLCNLDQRHALATAYAPGGGVRGGVTRLGNTQPSRTATVATCHATDHPCSPLHNFQLKINNK